MLNLNKLRLPKCHANNYVMMDANSGKILISKNAFEKTYPASTTKILTCLLALKKFDDLEKVITFPKVINYGSLMGVGEGEKIRIIDLLYGLMLPSGNDAAEAIAILASGSIEKFAEEMNELAKEIGCSVDSHYVNPHGVFNPDHTSTAYDMALITMAAMKNPLFLKIVNTGMYTCKSDKKEYTVHNTNALIHRKPGFNDRRYVYATGVKTGQTSKGYSLVSSAYKNDVSLVQVYLNSTDDFGTDKGWLHRFIDSKAMFEFVFDHYQTMAGHIADIK